MTPKVRVLLADDHAIVLEGLRALVDGEPDLQVVGSTTDGTAVADLVVQLRPDVVVLDLELAGIRGTEVLAALRALKEPPKVLILTAYNDGESIRSALDAGAEGLALKTQSPQQTIAAIRQVHAGQLVFPQAARRWLEERAGSGRGGREGADLTQREREVWALVARGLPNSEIAKKLGLSANTVKFHVQHLFHKLGVKNRTAAALKHASAERPSPSPGQPRTGGLSRFP
ncbi:MAG: response regulator transcription factor [Gemmatimonadetes bacterium]|nr:response regulator transcription factor [Gemmatimonadota bacterium]